MDIGDSYSFIPNAFCTSDPGTGCVPLGAPVRVTGQVIQVHTAHRWFRVRYEMYGCVHHECFPLQVPESDTPFEAEPHKHGYHKTKRSNGRFGKAKWS